jgi:hypothetical protein
MFGMVLFIMVAVVVLHLTLTAMLCAAEYERLSFVLRPTYITDHISRANFTLNGE